MTRLPQIIKLMVFRDAVQSSFRLWRQQDGLTTLESTVDQLFTILCGAGWSAEAIKYLRQLRKRGVLTQEEIDKLPQKEPINPRDVWLDLVEKTEQSDHLFRIRDKCFAHFDPELSEKIIELIAQERVEPTFVEWTEKQNSKSRMTVAWNAIRHHVFELDKPDPTERAHELGNMILSVGILLEHIITLFIAESKIKFQEVS